MKKLSIAFLLLSVVTIRVNAQKQPAAVVQLHIDSITKLITYEGVTEVGNIKADVLYKRALSWFNTFYKNPTEVIRENDELKFKIVGKPRFKIYNTPDKDGSKSDAGLIQYTITVAAKDGRFKYEITEFNLKQTSYFPCERWMDVKTQTSLPAYTGYLQQLNQYTLELIRDLKKAVMNEKPVKDKDSW